MKRKVILFICVILLSIFTVKIFSANFVDDKEFKEFVKYTYLTKGGYTKEISNHMSEDLFKRVNVNQIASNINEVEYKKPFKVKFDIRQNSKKILFNKAYINMTYNVEIKDSNNEVACGSWDAHVKFIIKKVKNNWYIVDKEEEA